MWRMLQPLSYTWQVALVIIVFKCFKLRPSMSYFEGWLTRCICASSINWARTAICFSREENKVENTSGSHMIWVQSRMQSHLLWTKIRALLCSRRNGKVHWVEVLQLHSSAKVGKLLSVWRIGRTVGTECVRQDTNECVYRQLLYSWCVSAFVRFVRSLWGVTVLMHVFILCIVQMALTARSPGFLSNLSVS